MVVYTISEVLRVDKHLKLCLICQGDDSITRTSQLNVGTAADVSLKITETDLSSLTASIRAPSGNEEPCLLKRLPNRHLGEIFTCQRHKIAQRVEHR